MLKRILFALFVTSIGATATHAQNYKTAVGLRLSSNDAMVNNSISVKHFLNHVVAIEGLISFKPAAVGALVEVHQPLSSVPGLRWLFGVGAYVGSIRDVNVGAQGIIGLDYKFTNIPINLSVDWKPELEFTDKFSFEPAVVGLTARFALK